MDRAPRALLAVTVTHLLVVSASLALPQDSSIAGYRQLVAEYRDGGARAVDRLARWPDTATETAVAAVLANPAGDWAVGDVRGAAMLHTDTGVWLLRRGETAAGVRHISHASRLLDAVVGIAPEHASYAARWHRFATAFVRPYSEPAARALGERVQAAPAAAPDWQASLQQARRRMTFGEPGTAEFLLRHAAGSPERRIRYLAALFMGELAERARRFDDAERSYREAAQIYPWAQAAPLALASLLSTTGREAEARVIVASHVGRARGSVVDPFWTFGRPPDELLDATLQELRVEVVR